MMDPEFPNSILGRSFDGWTTEDILGHGKSAYVFFARKSEEVAAVKVFSPDLIRAFGESDQLSRIKRQLKIRDRHHPHLVRIFSGGKDKEAGLLYLVMERVTGHTLANCLTRIPIERIGPLVSQIASAAHFLELNDLVHRDIKPDNIIISSDFRTATLLDLGVLRPLPVPIPSSGASDLTDEGSSIGPFLGTVRYSPPEFLFRTEAQTIEGWRAVTFYQLGAVLHDMVTGRRLFEFSATEWPRLVEAVRTSEPDLSEDKVRNGIPQHLVDLAKNCTQKKWNDRLETVAWDSFKCSRGRTAPTVVIIYAGGTIGAIKSDLDSNYRGLRAIENEGDPLLRSFEARILRDYRQLSGPEEPLPFEINWEFLNREDQALSENADCGTWNRLAEAVERVCSEYSPASKDPELRLPYYLAGIIVLHGTDTLAYSAAALSLSLRNLPCPVVLTGSNQPPNEKDIREQSILRSSSDAYRNIIQSLRFLRFFAHRFTEVFVCFGETVHPGINLRKAPIDSQPQASTTGMETLQEPFHYRNQGPQRQYAFRIVDDQICNNFYPLETGLTYDLFLTDPANFHRHVRDSPHTTRRTLQRAHLKNGVVCISTSPSSAHSEGLLRSTRGQQEGARVLLVEAYESGTLPTDHRHPFSKVIHEAFYASIPIALVSSSGLRPTLEMYESHGIDGMDVPLLRIFGMIKETAAPFLSIILGTIDEDLWSPKDWKGDAYGLLQQRLGLLRAGISRRRQDAAGILVSLLGDVLNERTQFQMALGSPRRDLNYQRITAELFTSAKGNLPKRTGLAKSKEGNFESSKTILLREHFLWLLAEILRPYELSRSGPDAFASLNEMGFTWGRQVSEALLRPEERHSALNLFVEETDPSHRESLIEVVKRQVKTITRFLFRYGVADIHAEIGLDSSQCSKDVPAYTLVCDVNAKKHGIGGRSDELFAARGYDRKELEFFHRLRNGADTSLYENECQVDLERRFEILFKDTWRRRLSVLDWFLVGVYRAIFCRSLCTLRFDPWVDICSGEDERSVSLLRQSTAMHIVVADRSMLRFQIRYRAREIFGA